MAAELVGGAVLSSFLQVAFDRLASLEILHYFQNRGLNESLVKNLKIMLIPINTVIDDAEYKQFSDSNVKAWLSELKDAVYDAEDVLDEINYELYKHKLEAEAETQTGLIAKVRKLFHASDSSFDEDIESRLKQVFERLQFLESRKITLGLKEGKGGAVGFATKLPTTSLVDEAGTYGRDKDKEIIIKWLLNDSHFSVMSIVGMGGLGKTTLAQLVYNDNRIQSEFDQTVWVCVSDDFNVLRLTKIIFNKIMSSSDDTEDLDILQKKLKDELSVKKFLIVLDDVWCDDCTSWEALLAPFICGVAGSRILVTSRNESVALAAPSDETFRPDQLSEDDGWLLLTKYAFRNSCSQTNSDLEEIGRRIVKKCKGLPLALKTIGSLLYKKSSWEEWNNILMSEMWNISCKNILPALILSYHYLPSHLKRCFAYCSLLPKDYRFVRETLVQLWVAQDFLSVSQPNKSIEVVGNKCFQEFVSRSFFQKIDETGFVMHDILNDLANFVSGEFCFKQEVKEVPRILEKTRHLSFRGHEFEEFRSFKYLPKIKKLQTFVFLRGPYDKWTSSGLIFDQLCELKCLRVLSLASNHDIVKIPNSVRNLIHLRYLDLSYCRIDRVPESICFLYNLQTLKLVNCRYLHELPTDLHKLKKLCLLDLRRTPMKNIPPNLGEIKNLQVRLTGFYVAKCSDELNIKQLGELDLHGSLSIYELQNAQGMNALEANLKEKKYLEDLSFQWNENKNDDSENERDVLEKLRPHPNLKKLSVKYYSGTRFPDWFADNTLSNIVALRLESCKYCSVLPSLGLLPSLKSLTIEGLDYIVVIGAELSSGSLESLELAEMVNWEEWDCTNASIAFPSLKELRIRNCPKLKEILTQQLPSLGPSLKSLTIEGLDGIVAIGAELSSGSLESLKLARMVNWEEWDCTNASSAFPSLKKLRIITCPKLKENLPQHLPSLGDLVIQDCPQLVALVPWAPTIRRLTLRNCEKMQLEYAPTSLKVLRFGGPCTNASLLEKIEHSINNNCIEEVWISDCPNLKFPLSQQHDSLSEIQIERSCGSLRTFPLDLFPALAELNLSRCDNLEMICISEGCNHVPTVLTWLDIRECPNFISFSEGGFSSLTWCQLDHLGNLKSLPEPMNTFVPSLGCLHIGNCPQLEPFPEGSLPTKLWRLSIDNCPKLLACRMKWGLHNLGFLRSFEISGDDAVESLPEPGLLPAFLTYLSITRCSNLRMLDYKALCQCPSLGQLDLLDCPTLQCLPTEGLPSSLKILNIEGDCPELKQRCQKLKGQDWPKIAHIRDVHIS